MSIIDFGSEFGDLMEEWGIIRQPIQEDDAEGQAIISQESNPDGIIMAMPPQPVNEKEINKDFGGEFVRDLQKTYTHELVKTRDGDIPADRLTFDDIMYEVYKVSKRTSLGGHYKVYLREWQGDF